jgi:hypothetical protein
MHFANFLCSFHNFWLFFTNFVTFVEVFLFWHQQL